MSSASIREPGSFGKRASTHTITVTRNGQSRQFNINPVAFSICVCFGIMFMIGYFGATAYLVFRDDLISASYAKHARMKHEYEDRIAALRSKLDHVTSRQLLDQQAIENRVRRLMERQEIIGERGGALGKVMEKARSMGIQPTTIGSVPVPTASPSKAGSNVDSFTTGSLERTLTPESKTQIATAFSIRGSQGGLAEAQAISGSYNSFTDRLFSEITQSMNTIETNQKRHVDFMRIATNKRAKRLETVLGGLGVRVAKEQPSGIGGPFIPLDESTSFSVYVDALEDSLEHLDTLSTKARALPLAYPVANPKVSSRYGSRKDPFNGRIAMHSGIDFKGRTGTPVMAAGSGKVIRAGRKGGYGKVVEIQHRNGMITRYAHLSRILVKKGQHVEVGKRIGKIGSTGRSTGPHLHYEVRSGKRSHDPARFLNAGRKIRDLL